MLKVAREGNRYRVELFQVNRLNTLFSELVEKQLQELVEEEGVTVIFNLQGIKFIDTAGFQVLQEIADRARKNGNDFRLCNVGEEVKELIILLELEGRFTFCECEHAEEKILLVLD